MELTTQRFLFEGWNGRGWFFYNEIGQYVHFMNPLNGRTFAQYCYCNIARYEKLHRAILKNCTKLNELIDLLRGDIDCKNLALLLLGLDDTFTHTFVYVVLINLTENYEKWQF